MKPADSNKINRNRDRESLDDTSLVERLTGDNKCLLLLHYGNQSSETLVCQNSGCDGNVSLSFSYLWILKQAFISMVGKLLHLWPTGSTPPSIHIHGESPLTWLWTWVMWHTLINGILARTMQAEVRWTLAHWGLSSYKAPSGKSEQTTKRQETNGKMRAEEPDVSHLRVNKPSERW